MSQPGTAVDLSCRERRLYYSLFLVLLLAYLISGFVLPGRGGNGSRVRELLFGFSQLGCFGMPCILVGLSIPLVLLVIRPMIPRGKLGSIRARAVRVFNSTWFRVGFAILLAAVFFLLRNRFINYDGSLFAEKFARDVPLHGAHVTHDEMWELYLHSRFWFHTNRLFGWSVELSYQVLSSVAGGVFIMLLMYYCTIVFPERPVLAFVICISGGYMQLFFGDVENYTLTATLIMAYFLASAMHIRGKWSVITPSVILAAALTFHLLAGFLVPSLLMLYDREWKRGERRRVLTAAAIFCMVVGSTILFFHFNGLPVRDLWYNSHAFGFGGHIRQWLVDPSPGYYLKMLNLAFLLAPVWVLLIPQLLFGRVRLDELNMHLIIAAAFMGVFFIGWKATLGVYSDWNMFAAAALPFTFLVLRNLLSTECIRGRFWLVYMFAWLFALHSYSWVAANHFYSAPV
jgi:hypothetical protein